jgi:hypothetical protein
VGGGGGGEGRGVIVVGEEFGGGGGVDLGVGGIEVYGVLESCGIGRYFGREVKGGGLVLGGL